MIGSPACRRPIQKHSVCTSNIYVGKPNNSCALILLLFRFITDIRNNSMSWLERKIYLRGTAWLVQEHTIQCSSMPWSSCNETLTSAAHIPRKKLSIQSEILKRQGQLFKVITQRQCKPSRFKWPQVRSIWVPLTRSTSELIVIFDSLLSICRIHFVL